MGRNQAGRRPCAGGEAGILSFQLFTLFSSKLCASLPASAQDACCIPSRRQTCPKCHWLRRQKRCKYHWITQPMAISKSPRPLAAKHRQSREGGGTQGQLSERRALRTEAELIGRGQCGVGTTSESLQSVGFKNEAQCRGTENSTPESRELELAGCWGACRVPSARVLRWGFSGWAWATCPTKKTPRPSLQLLSLTPAPSCPPAQAKACSSAWPFRVLLCTSF